MKKTITILLLFTLLVTSCEWNKENSIKTDTGSTEINPGNPFNSIAFDKKGNPWFGTQNGLVHFNGATINTYDLRLADKKINALTIISDSLWAATNEGLLCLNIANEENIQITMNYTVENSNLVSNEILVVSVDPLGRIWAGTSLGVSVKEGSEWKNNREIVSSLNKLSGNPVNCMDFNVNGYFMGTYGRSLYHIILDEVDAVTGASQMIGGIDTDVETINYNGNFTTDTIFCVAASGDSSIWFGSLKGLTRNKGLTHTGFKGAIFEYFLEGQKVFTVFESSEGDIWAGTETGIYVRRNNTWTNYTVSDGLPDNSIKAMSEGKDGQIWVISNHGISWFKDNEFVTLFDSTSPTQNQSIQF